MNKTMMDILACPIDKYHPLELHEIKEKDNVISEGALFCPKCSRFYPIIEEIKFSHNNLLSDSLILSVLKNVRITSICNLKSSITN